MEVSHHNQRAALVGAVRSLRPLWIVAFWLIAFCAVASAQEVASDKPVASREAAANDTTPSLDPPQATSQVTSLNASSPDAASAAAEPPPGEVAPVSKRLFGVIPNYRADQNSGTYQPLTLAEKYKIARQDSFDWPNFPLLAGYALQAQIAAGGFHNNGGMKGFGEYYARGFADQVIGSYVTEAILPGLLHEDPRYFRLGTGRFMHRISYATSHVFVTRGDNGKTRFFASEVLGNAAVAALGSLYYPNSGTLSEIGEHYGLQLGNDAVSNILTEFWPDIRLRLRFVRQRLVTSLFHH